MNSGDVLKLLMVDQDAWRRAYRAKADIHVLEDAVLAGKDASAADFQRAVFSP